MSNSTKMDDLWGVGAEFDSAAATYEAAKKVRDAGYHRWDVHSPFPIHGMDDAMGMGKSPLGYIVFIGGMIGFLIALSLQFIPSTFLYPMIVHGKPTDWATIPAFVPILFELTVLLSAFTTLFGMLILNGLPRLHHPAFNWDRFAAVTDDKFFIIIEKNDAEFELEKSTQLLKDAGGQHVTAIFDRDEAEEPANQPSGQSMSASSAIAQSSSA
jgi:hypothetical protein